MDKEGWIGMIPHGPVKAYGYRKAHVVGGICFTPKRAIYDRVLDTLIRRSGLSEYEGKNHILFVFDGLAVQFDDYVISVSASYEVKSW